MKIIHDILLVDDDATLRKALKIFLERLKYRCAEAANAKEAMKALAAQKFDLVISDLNMGGMNGVELMQTVKKEHPELDFIIITGYTSEYAYGDIIKAGAADYLSKPFEMVELTARIDRLEREKKILLELLDVNQRLESAMGQAQKMAEKAERASRAKSDFLASMSHEIRTPLNAIIGFTDILIDTPLSSEQNDYIKTIKVSSESLLALINDILDSSKIEAGKMSLENIDFDPEVLCYDVCELIRPRITGKPVTVMCHIGDGVPGQICGDPFRFRQVLLNLMGNATKFTPSGKIELFLDAEEKNGEVDIRAVVQDSGIGIPVHEQEIIFEPFQQSGESRSFKKGGTGLGLSICRKIATLMGGEIWVESEFGKGSRFYFTAKMKKSEEIAPQWSSPVELPGRRALIVGANYTNLNILQQALMSKGMAVTSVEDPADALPSLRKAAGGDKPFDICFIDTNTLGEEGFQLVRRIREQLSPDAPVSLAALASSLPGRAKHCAQAGFDGFISKPIRREKLFHMVRKLLGDRQEGASSKTERSIVTQYSIREEMKRSVRILVAEDNPVNQQLVKVMLVKGGYSVDVAKNGREAFEIYSRSPEKVDIILMDIQMPELDGVEATRMIRQWEKNAASEDRGKKRNVPIIAVTANAMKEDRSKCLSTGMNDYLVKPIKRELVFEAIEKWVLQTKDA